jgi:MFS family permease
VAFRRFLRIRMIDEIGVQILGVTLAWHLYDTTRDPVSLAYAGLSRFLPNAAFALVSGHAADRFDRRWIIALSLALQAICLMAACAVVALPPGAIYLLLAAFGAAQAFLFPAMTAMQPQLVSADEFARTVATSSTVLQVCTLAAPALGGVLVSWSERRLFALLAAMYLLAITQVRQLPRGYAGKASAGSPMDGLRCIRCNRLLLSLISLDLFAVLLGGVTALLPIYARDILAAGPIGLGCLLCAPGVGAAMVGVALSRWAIQRGTGKQMLTAVAGFGLATVTFAFSTNLWVSLTALAAAGGCDMISMVIRQTLLQVSTPEAVRGRVSAVQGVFIGASSELGEVESGATAALFGAVPAALLGGLGTLAVVALWTWLFPELRQTDHLAADSDGLRYATGSGHEQNKTAQDQAA